MNLENIEEATNVGELIEILKKYPSEYRVIIEGRPLLIRKAEVVSDESGEWIKPYTASASHKALIFEGRWKTI